MVMGHGVVRFACDLNQPSFLLIIMAVFFFILLRVCSAWKEKSVSPLTSNFFLSLVFSASFIFNGCLEKASFKPFDIKVVFSSSICFSTS
ncbi:MAG: hypothetical protein J3R72DRAFT_261885 [Linnemannia gamsii]|nr:MAG: hypothetical protein J3R72DRAFT_261885 [Linnemannia gamsii]